MMDRTKIQVALIQGSFDKASCNFGVLIDSPIKKIISCNNLSSWHSVYL